MGTLCLNVNLFVAGALDATLAQSYNEYYQLLQCGVTLNEENVYRFSEHGYNVQQEGLYMTKDYYMRTATRHVVLPKPVRRAGCGRQNILRRRWRS